MNIAPVATPRMAAATVRVMTTGFRNNRRPSRTCAPIRLPASLSSSPSLPSSRRDHQTNMVMITAGMAYR